MTEYVDSPMGQVATSPEGDWDPGREYKRFKTVLHDHDSWISRKDGNKGNEPADGSPWWFRATQGGKHAYEQGEQARLKAEEAQRQADRAKGFADHQPKVVDGWWQIWSETEQRYVDSHRAVIGPETFTDDERQNMIDRIVTPHVVGSTLVFPSTSTARISGSTLILTE